MSTRGAGMTWVGRAIRRLEDPALVQGQGRFTADLHRRALCALRAQPSGGWKNQKDRRAAGRDGDHRR